MNGKILWLCEEHKNASRSETEKRYQDRFEQKSDDIPIPTGGKSFLGIDLHFVIPMVVTTFWCSQTMLETENSPGTGPKVIKYMYFSCSIS